MPVIKPIIHLCIPQLLQPLALWKKDFLFEPEAPELASLLRQFDQRAHAGIQGLDASLFHAVGISSNTDIPIANFRFKSHLKKNPKHFMLCADPIHLEVGMNDITLTQVIDDLSDDEAEELIDDLNQHFKQDELEFVRGSNRHWYIVLPEQEAVKSTPLDEVLRKNIKNYLTHSETRNWNVLQNEAQMILHASAVNNQREMAGLPTVNSLWFWGGGEIDVNDSGQKDVVCVYHNESYEAETKAKTVATAVNCEVEQLAEDGNHLAALKGKNQGKSIIILDQLFQAAINDNLDSYQRALTKLDAQIIKPLNQAWQAGKIEIIIDGCDGKTLKPTKPSVWKFWKNKPISLADI